MTVSLVTPQELKLLLESDRKPVVVDSRPHDEYAHAHIPSAVELAWEDFCEVPTDVSQELKQPGYWGKLDDQRLSAIVRRLSEAGIGNQQMVVVYSDAPRSKGREGRIAWMLLYLGVENVAMLNGGWRAWLAERGATESGAPDARTPSAFEPRLDHERRISLDQLRALIEENPQAPLVDTRTLEEFEGRLYTYQPRMGRLPSSVNIPYSTLFTQEGLFLDRKEFTALLKGAGNQQLEPAVTYCEVGVRAATFALLFEIHTGKKLPVYDGSIMEWSLDAGLPVVSGLTEAK